MKTVYSILEAIVIVVILLVINGCRETFIITQQLEKDIKGSICSIGEVHDFLPIDVRPYNKPSRDEILILREEFGKYLAETGLFKSIQLDNPLAEYEIKFTLLKFKKSDEFKQITNSALTNTAEITIATELIDMKTNRLIFGLNIKYEASYWAYSNGDLYRYVAECFSSALKKSERKIRNRH